MSGDLPDISPMHELEVWCASTRRWVRGFWFDGLEADGSVRIRRGIDLHVIPGSFPATKVRRAAPIESDGPRGWGPPAAGAPSLSR
jgi:hypothetical protein